MLKTLNQFMFTCSMLALFPISAHATPCENEDGLKPVKTAQANYPRRAHSRGIEGHVELQFTISTEGNVKDVAIIESKPKGVFDRASVRTIKQYKFIPCMANGAPIEVTQVKQILSFSLEQ